MNKQKCKSTMKRLFSEARLHGIAKVHTCTSVVVPMQISIVALTYCRMAIWIYFNSETGKQIGKSTMICIYKSIIIHLFKDSKQ
jgi:hypothetical protein